MELQNIESEFFNESTCDLLISSEIYNNPSNSKEKLITLLELQAGPTKIEKCVLLDLFLNIKKIHIPEASNTNEIRKAIKEAFYKQKPEELCNKFDYICCNQNIHTARCIYKWKIVKQGLVNLVDALYTKNKPIFAINRRQNNRCKTLLNSNQPCWVHKLFLESISVIGKIN